MTAEDVATLSASTGLTQELGVIDEGAARPIAAARPLPTGAPPSKTRATTEIEKPPPSTSPQKTAAESPAVDDYINKLLKYIPAEIVAGFVTVDGIIRSVTQAPIFIYWIVFAIFLILTPVYTGRISTVAGLPTAWTQIIVATVGFLVWVFALGGPFSYFGWYLPAYGSILLVVFTLVIPALLGKKKVQEGQGYR
jgi:hypothetical protein